MIRLNKIRTWLPLSCRQAYDEMCAAQTVRMKGEGMTIYDVYSDPRDVDAFVKELGELVGNDHDIRPVTSMLQVYQFGFPGGITATALNALDTIVRNSLLSYDHIQHINAQRFDGPNKVLMTEVTILPLI